MAEKYSIGLLGVMDHLWFHQIILLSETHSVSFPKNVEKTLPIQDSLTCSPKNQYQELSSVESESTLLQDVCEKQEAIEKERPTRLNLVATRKSRSHSSSPATDKRYSRTDRYLKDSGSIVLEKTMSCRTLGELELEEVKGFMDLGFIFRKEHISKRMISVIPGLQRLEEVVMSEDEEKICEDSKANSVNGIVAEEEDDKREIARPYLSEAWLIKRPDSPLLNLRIPRISAGADMKKH
ncbi:uncharacterized protein LOC132605408 [Lycium barbarum]|uniref:uncharacterized protein LOC132605408 n=1 Tax=Lycium barbarum TaxID=112863 RepID=UPI00293F66F1|nr:uncharacterized protein LOC132605408 [Lycium barbarum]